ncbi:MAG TPA: PAS domain S-box protein [Trebonia sp.]
MAPLKFGIRQWAVTGAVLALAAVAVACGIALAAVAAARADGQLLSQRLVPAADTANNVFTGFTRQQVALRTAVTGGRVSDLALADNAEAEISASAAQLAGLARGDRGLSAPLGTLMTAYRAWNAHVAAPQAAALRGGDAAAARALQADTANVARYGAAVRRAADTLDAGIIGEQRAAASALQQEQNTLLGSLIAVAAVAAATAAAIVAGAWCGLLRPLGQLNQAVSVVADGRYHRSVPTVGPAELAGLSRGVERMRTRLVAALAERERAEASLRQLFDLAPDAMIAVDQDNTITMANARAVQVFGYAVHEMLGHQAQMLVPEEARAALAVHSATYFADRRSRSQWDGATAAGQRRDGSTFPAEVRLSLLPSDDGTVNIVAIRDVSERVALEAERERLRAAAEQERLQRRQQQSQRLESLGQLVGGVAHDFNNLLNVISGYADFTAEQLQAIAGEDHRLEPVLADVEQVRTAAQQAIRVTRQLLTFAKSGAANREVLDLNEVVRGSGELLRRSLGERVELVITAHPGLWRVDADRGQLEQVLVNLAVNARDAMPGGGRLTIATANTEVDDVYAEQRPNLQPGHYCCLAVSDTGTGMDAATVERVFEPFFSTKPRGRGTGLGLATVYGIVTGLGGTIDIYSEEGLGTTMNVLLPVTTRDASLRAETGPAGEQAAAGDGTAAEDGTAAGPESVLVAGAPRPAPTILLVEDEASLRAMASRILARNGYQVIEAADGEHALAQADRLDQPIDLLVTDMVMPGMLGSEVVDRVRALRPGLPAVFMTGYAQHVLDFHGFQSPDLDIVQKPFTESALLTRVRQALERPLLPRQQGPNNPAPDETVPPQPAPPGSVRA